MYSYVHDDVNLQLLSCLFGFFFPLGQDKVAEASTGRKVGGAGGGEGVLHHERDGQDAVGHFVKASYRPITSPFFFPKRMLLLSLFLLLHLISAE